jgi:hypothetical protein
VTSLAAGALASFVLNSRRPRQTREIVRMSPQKYPGATLTIRNEDEPMSIVRLIHDTGTSLMS